VIAAAIVAASQRLISDRLTTGTSGNISVRDGRRAWITPSGVAPGEMAAEQVVAVDLDGGPLSDDGLRPSSEWQFHVAVYCARPDVGAIVHTHSPWATAVSCTRRDMPPFHYMMVGTGDGTLKCAPYNPPGSDRLAAGVVEALGQRAACLLANHGVVATGSNLAAAEAMAREVETLAQQYCVAQMIGGPTSLDGEQVEELVEIFKAYGQQTGERPSDTHG